MNRLCLSLFVCLVWNIPFAFGQRVEISASQYFEAITPVTGLPRFPTRSIRTEELFEKGRLIGTVVEKFEGTPATACRLTVVKTEHGVEKTFEQIELGDFIYTRSDKGNWLKQPWFLQHPRSEVSTDFLDTVTYRKETIIIGASKVTVFRESIATMLNKSSRGFRDNDYYFGPEGKFLKRVTTYRTQNNPSIITRRITYTSEYDSSINIEAPVK